MKIYYFSDYYPPESNAPALRVKFNAEHFAKNDVEVTVVTCNPNFPDGQLYEGYQNAWIQNEFENGVKIVRLWSYMAANKGYVRRIIDHISSAVMFFFYAMRIKRSECVIATSPQFMTILFLTFAKHIRKFNLVVEIRDKWPDGIIFMDRRSLIFKVLKKLEHWIYSSSDSIVVVTASFKEQIIAETRCPSDKIIVSYNGSDLDKRIEYHRSNTSARILPEFNGTTIGYAGTIGISHDLEAFCKEFKNFNLQNLRLVFVGSGALLEELKERYSCETILFLDRISQDTIPLFYKEIDIALISLKDIDIYDHVIPSKLFEAIAYETPIYGLLRGEAARIILDNSVGVVPTKRDMKNQKLALGLLIKRLGSDTMRRHLKETGEKYSRLNQAEEILKCLKRK